MASSAGLQKLRFRVLAVALAAGAALAGPDATRAETQSPSGGPSQATWPSRVRALYKIEFNGFDIGSFEFSSSVSGSSYTLTGDARISALLGVITWTGATRTAGQVGASDPRPAGYTFDYNSSGKAGTIRMAFQGEKVTSVAQSPTPPPSPDVVPLAEAHLKGVVDPLSAVMTMSRSSGANPCARRIPVFDGRQRFDLTLSYKGQARVAEVQPSGQPGVAYVCRVKYTPIAGHKQNEETRGLAASDGIEVALRPIPSANLFIPYQITIPTMAGPASLTAQRVEIITSHNEQIAMVY